MTYPHRKIEQKWQKKWAETKAFEFDENSTKPKAYVLEMFPYPSGKLHMGHVRNYAIGDAIARFKHLKGFNVLHPMGWDAFGLPAENAAMEHKTHPKKWTYENIGSMRDQFKTLGFSFAWEREFASCDTLYYGLEQKLFLDLYKKGLAYQSESWVNWDPVEHTVLANEQVVGGRGWRSGAVVEKKKLNQWSLKITDYADELLNDLDKLDKWPEKVRKMQENWIGKSHGALIHFQLSDGTKLEVFSTRPETLYGASFIAIAPTHPITDELAKTDGALAAFVKDCQQTSTAEADLATAEKKGHKTTLTATHPFTGEVLPVFAANFVLMEYGTGAVFACPAHDERDFEFATKYNLPIKRVIKGPSEDDLPYTGDGVMIDSQELDGLTVGDARKKSIELLQQKNAGEGKVTYRLRDWGVSRQRYWGCPIPIVHCKDCGMVPVPEAQLPVLLPEDPDFSKAGNPLERHPTWKHVKCPTCHADAMRETDTFDTFFESSWYFLRFTAPKSQSPVEKEPANRLMPVDCYIGGVEHAVLHLLYSRFFTKALRDLGYVDCDEPFRELLTQGMVCHQTYTDKDGHWVLPTDVIKNKDGSFALKDGSPVTIGRTEKMSKSKKNLVEPSTIIDSYGADAARLFILSDTPYDRDFDWNEDSLDGAWRYLSRLYRVHEQVKAYTNDSVDSAATKALEKTTHRAIMNISDSYEKYGFNKALALHREFCRAIDEALSQKVSADQIKTSFKALLMMISPIAPHLASELWEQLSENGTSLHDSSWPSFDPDLAALDEITIAVQVNGKLRGSIQVTPNASEDELKKAAFGLSAVQKETNGKDIRRVIIVPGRIVNIVV